ncbi:MinD/ParA family ATP-binding protein [Agrococcus casei]|uniref:MinD/ParA family ATP-binding protein n=1 Tax=Agrococcus casei TaxID=343512 RepID=UPI00117783B7|nr:hypothetical protein [Agrococcus casei]
MVFEGARRAGDYEESAEGEPITRKELRQQPGDFTPPPAAYTPGMVAGAPVENPIGVQQQPMQQPPAAPRLDIEALSMDLSGSWLHGERQQQQAVDGKATQGLRGALARLGLPVGPGAGERAARERTAALAAAEARVRQATFTRSQTVLIAQPKGGIGKTSLSIALGGTFASVRGGQTVIAEVSDDPGTLALRSEGTPRRGLGELVRDVSTISSAGELGGYTAPQTSHAAVIGSPNPRTLLTGEHVAAVHELLSAYYSLQVFDSGNVYTSGAFVSAVAAADALVIPVTDAADSLQHVLALIRDLRQTEHGARLVSGATIVRLRYVDAEPSTVQRVDDVLAQLNVRNILDVPSDPHLGERSEVTLSKLQPATTEALLHVAAAVITTLQEQRETEKN